MKLHFQSTILLLVASTLLLSSCGKFEARAEQSYSPVKEEIEESGFIRPTLYYFTLIDEDKTTCSQKVTMNVEKGQALKVCPDTLRTCTLQGSCAITKQGVTHSYNVMSKRGVIRFAEIAVGSCRFGFGVNSSCLDPFFTVAADLALYKPGDVIFVPAAVGLLLPNGQKHNGFFVIRDEGGNVKGKGRFDFFSGDISWKSDRNPFTKIGLQSLSTHVPYFKIRGRRAQFIRESRRYPGLP